MKGKLGRANWRGKEARCEVGWSAREKDGEHKRGYGMV